MKIATYFGAVKLLLFWLAAASMVLLAIVRPIRTKPSYFVGSRASHSERNLCQPRHAVPMGSP